jgi:hypothetical protein
LCGQAVELGDTLTWKMPEETTQEPEEDTVQEPEEETVEPEEMLQEFVAQGG